MESGHRFDAQTLHSFIQAVFRQMGSEEQEAKLVADHLIAANLAGHDSHGIGMIPSYVRSWSQGHLQINHHAKIVKEAGAAVTLDGRSGLLGSHIDFGDLRRGWNFRSLGHGGVNFEEIIRVLNAAGYEGPLSVEWEDSGMERIYGATEACEFVRGVDFKPSDVAFDKAIAND